MELDVVSLNKICRTCICEASQLHSLFEGYECPNESPRLDEMLMVCASVQVMIGDGLPSRICDICVKKLISAFHFKKQCEKTDASLRKYARTIEADEIKEEPQNCDSRESLSHFTNTKTNNNETITPKIETGNQIVSDTNSVLNDRTHLKSVRLYRCNKCDKKYTRSDHLQRHTNSHCQKKVHVCKICGKSLSRMEHVKRHLVTHLKTKPFSCNTCNRVFNRVEHLQIHMPRCKRDTVYPCDICNKVFKHPDSLRVHKEMHGNQPKLRTIDNLDDIEEHYYQIDQDMDSLEPQVGEIENKHSHKQEMVDTDFIDDDNSVGENFVGSDNDDLESSENKLEKELKNKEEDSKPVKEEDSFKIHNDVSDNDDKTSDFANEASDESDDSTDTENDPNKNSPQNTKPWHAQSLTESRLRKKIEKEECSEFACPVCQEIFATANALDRHAIFKHRDMKIHKCNMCGKKFTRHHHMRRHMTVHSCVKLFHCDMCPKGFNRKDNLVQHMRMHNKGSVFADCDVDEKVASEKAYKCSLCLKSFSTERYRDIHIKKHSIVKVFPCKVCQETFPSKSELTKHSKSHNKQVKKFLCSECGQRFVRNDYLIVHMRRHRGEKPFVCKCCGKGFPRTTDLTAHERYHTGEKNHLCTVCGKGFGRPYNLTIHMRTHTAKKKYQCTYCDATFTHSNDLKLHVRMHMKAKFQCRLCKDRFLTNYLLTQHKRLIHGLKIGSNLLRLQPIPRKENNICNGV